VQRSLLQILRIVTAFTLGHSLTLGLAAFGLVQLPSRPVEVLIAVSILLSAIHAIRPLFPGREAAIAAFFGLIHGLAFASALGDLGFSSWYRLVSLLGFNLGIEAMQLTVVAVTLPSLLLLRRTRLLRSDCRNRLDHRAFAQHGKRDRSVRGECRAPCSVDCRGPPAAQPLLLVSARRRKRDKRKCLTTVLPSPPFMRDNAATDNINTRRIASTLKSSRVFVRAANATVSRSPKSGS
jgi:hypothetical protein